MPGISNDNITNLLQSYLSVQSRKAEVISGNIANADTPNYIAKELNFGEYMNEAVRQSQLSPSEQDSDRLSSYEPNVVDQESDTIGLDGNTVDTGREMSELAQTGSNFNFGAKMLQSRLKLLRMAIREGK